MSTTPPPSRSLTALDVEAAYVHLRSVARETPLQRNDRIGSALGADVWFKREDLQPVRSYKIRGAFTMMSRLSAAERARGVVCASAGNHAQGFAHACRTLDLRGRIYLPGPTPRQKKQRIAALGGDHVEIIVLGDTYDDAAAAAREDASRTGAVEIPAFDHPAIMAGQGSLAIEIIDQLGRAPDVVVIPVGGAGMLAGCLTWLSERHPSVRVIAVEPAGAASLTAALAAGGPVTLEEMDTFVDGAAVRRLGDATYPVAAAARDEGRLDVVTVREGRVCTEMLDLYQIDGIIAEPAGALASAALLAHRDQLGIAPGETVVAVLSGGNNDVSRYAEIVERSLVDEGRKHYFMVNFPQEPGALRRFLGEVLGPGDDIVHFEYIKRSNRETGPALVGIELGDPATLEALLTRMAESSIVVERIDAASSTYRFLI